MTNKERQLIIEIDGFYHSEFELICYASLSIFIFVSNSEVGWLGLLLSAWGR